MTDVLPPPTPASPEPTPDPGPPAAVPSSGWPDGLISAMPFLALVGVLAIAAGGVLLAVPVRNPKIQECGAPVAFLLRGRVDIYADPTNPPAGLTKAQANAANQDRCGHRVAGRAVPGGLLIVSGLAVGLAAGGAEWAARGARRRRLLARAP
ncbi:MAG TPA: hypothetical protein VGM93_01685 [Acidimicrobiales bacterium]